MITTAPELPGCPAGIHNRKACWDGSGLVDMDSDRCTMISVMSWFFQLTCYLTPDTVYKTYATKVVMDTPPGGNDTYSVLSHTVRQPTQPVTLLLIDSSYRASWWLLCKYTDYWQCWHVWCLTVCRWELILRRSDVTTLRHMWVMQSLLLQQLVSLVGDTQETEWQQLRKSKQMLGRCR